MESHCTPPAVETAQNFLVLLGQFSLASTSSTTSRRSGGYQGQSKRRESEELLGRAAGLVGGEKSVRPCWLD